MIDFDKLLEYCDNDPDLVSSFLEMFRAKADAALVEMPMQKTNGSWEDLSNTAHKMKSQCRYIGDEELANLAERIEMRAERGEVGSIDTLLDEFYTRLRTMLESF